MAISFQRLVDEVNLTQEQLSEKVGKDRATVANYLRLLKLPPEIQLGLRQRLITMGHARALISIADPQKQMDLYRRIIESQLTVRQVEEEARERSPLGRFNPPVRMSTARQKELSRYFAGIFGTKVLVKQGDTGKGRIEISFKDDQDLDRIKQLLESK